MKSIYTLFFSLVALSISAQTDNLTWNSFPQPLQNRTLIETCDTAKITLNLLDESTTEEDFPFTITRQGTATTDDIWTNIEGVSTIDFANPSQEIMILPYVDEEIDTGKELVFRVESALGAVKVWTIFLYDEFEEFEIEISLWDGSDSIPCSNSNYGFNMSIEQDTDEIDDYNNYYSYQWISGQANATGTYVYVGIDGSFYIDDDTVSVEIAALNCSQTIYKIFPEGYDITLDTFACRSSIPVEFNGEFFFNNYNYNAATKNLILVAENGCDSIVRLIVRWLPNETQTEVIYKNPEEVIDFNGTPITEYGNYESFGQTWQGCDSNHLLTVLPIETQSNLTYLPDSITTSTVSCINETCLPIYLPDMDDYTISIDNEIIEPTFTNACEVPFAVYEWRGLDYFFDNGSGNYGIESIVYNNDTVSIDFNYENIDELIAGLNHYFPNFHFNKSQNNEDLYLMNKPAGFEDLTMYLLDRLTASTRYVHLDLWLSNIDIKGLYLTTEPGIKNLIIKHNITTEEKSIIVDFKPLTYPIPTDTTVLEYYPELGQRVIFPLSTNELCLDFTSVEMTCPENWEGIVDYTIDNAGNFSFKPLKAYNSTACFRLCDDLGVCKEILLKLKFNGEQTDPTQFTANIYPNPAQEMLTITTKLGINISQINTFNLAGQLIDEFKPFPRNYAEIDISRYAEGLYFIEVMTTGGEDFLDKIVIQR